MADYIDRQAAIELCDWYQHEFCECDYAFGELANELHKLPSADVQPVRHGKWIKAQRKGIISYADGYAECNKCHEVSYLGWNDKYCRNCGARMDGEQNETD